MRWVLALSLLLLARPARAESVDFLLTNLDETATWSLEVDVAPAVSVRTILLEASQSLGVFTPAPGLTALQAAPLVPAGDRSLLGTFAGTTDSPVEIELVGADVSAGATVLDVAGISLDYSIRIVPEPVLSALALLAVGAAVGARLTAP